MILFEILIRYSEEISEFTKGETAMGLNLNFITLFADDPGQIT